MASKILKAEDGDYPPMLPKVLTFKTAIVEPCRECGYESYDYARWNVCPACETAKDHEAYG